MTIAAERSKALMLKNIFHVSTMMQKIMVLGSTYLRIQRSIRFYTTCPVIMRGIEGKIAHNIVSLEGRYR